MNATGRPAARIVLVANNFPPVRGGSAIVYGNLARCAAGRLIVLAPSLNYADGLPIIGWREYDRIHPGCTIRLKLLRTELPERAPSGLLKLRFLLRDATLRIRVAWALGRLVAASGVRTICVGELQASAWIIHLFAAIPGVRTMAYVHGEEITTKDDYDPGHRRMRGALLACDRIVVVSRFTERALARLLGSQAGGRVTLIENGVDGGRFLPDDKAQDLLDFYGLRDCFVFVTVCRLLEKKGVDNTIRAFSRLQASMPDCRLLIVGGGPFRDALAILATELGLQGSVVFAGQVADAELVDHYRLGDVFIMPNRELPNGDTEGFGLVFLEANSCGLPVIAGQDGGSTDAVKDGVNGLVVDGNSVDAIEFAMARLHGDAALRDVLIQGGLDAATAAGWEAKTEAFLRLCSEERE